MFPNKIDKTFLPCAKVMGEFNKRKKPYRPASVINVSAMSFGSLSAKAVESLNKGVKIAGAYHNTGEGGIIITNNKKIAHKCRLIRNHAEVTVGKSNSRELVNMIGYNFRLTEIQAAIGIEQLKKLKKLVGENVEIAFETLDEKNEELMIKEGIGKNKKW